MDTKKTSLPHNFILTGNSLAINFANSTFGVDGNETLNSWKDVINFIKISEGLSSSPPQNSHRTKPLFARVLELRKVIRNILESMVSQKAIKTSDLKFVNALLFETADYDIIQVVFGKPLVKRRYYRQTPLALLSPIVQNLLYLISTKSTSLIHKCARENCIYYFYDVSKTHKRKWCSMAVCGNREKVRAFNCKDTQNSRSKKSFSK